MGHEKSGERLMGVWGVGGVEVKFTWITVMRLTLARRVLVVASAIVFQDGNNDEYEVARWCWLTCHGCRVLTTYEWTSEGRWGKSTPILGYDLEKMGVGS